MTTTTAVPSSDVGDFLYNVQQLDNIVTGSASTYTDRLGQQRSTAAGAMTRFAALNPRGAWVTATLYQPRDLVLVSGTWYIALDTHTSGATFAGDLSAHWRPEQGVTRADMASVSSASDGSGIPNHSASLNYVAGTLGAKALERWSICDYPWLSVGDGAMTTAAGQPIGAGTGTDNAAKIQAAHDAIVASGKRRILEIPQGIFRCDTGLKINAEFVTLHFMGGILDFRNIGNSAGIQVYSTAQYQKQTLWCTGSGAITGPVAGVAPTSKGLFYQSNTGGVGTADISLTGASGLSVYHFAESVQVGLNAYLCGHSECHFWFSQRFFYAPAGLTNSGQKWPFMNCSFVNGVNGFYINEPTINVELHSCDILPTGGYAFAPESGYIAMFGGGIEVDASVGSQLIKNTNAGGGAKSTFISVGANYLYKNSTTQPFIQLDSLNTYVELKGGHASVAAGSTFFAGTGSGQLVLDNVLPDGALDYANSGSLGAGFSLVRKNQPFTGNSTQTGTHRAAGLISTPAAGGSIAALNGNSSNQVVITGAYTTLFTATGCFLIIIRDNTVGGCAVKIYDSGSGVVGSLYDNIGATVQFQHTGTAFQARTTAGTATRTMIILAIKV